MTYDDAGSGSPDGPPRHDRQEQCLDRPREPLPTRVEALPALPPAFDEALARGLAALRLTLDPPARAAIDGHVRLLLAWNRAINLTAIREPADIAVRHVLDSLTALPLLRDVVRLLDLGSGGGFPGLSLAAALPAEALLVDSIAKKTAFLATVAEATGLADRVRVATARAEALGHDPAQREGWPVVTARAVGELADLVELALPLLAPGGRLVAWKRGDLAAELAAAEVAGAALGGASIEVHEVTLAELPGHALVVVTRTGRLVADYPRDPASRRRRPWRPARSGRA